MNRVSGLIYGAPPPPDAQQADRLRYLRQIVVRHAAGVPPIAVLVLVLLHEYWGLVLVGVVLVVGGYIVVKLNGEIRRAVQSPSDPFGG
jgi:hypothetical protein